jgi:hypothetical protein
MTDGTENQNMKSCGTYGIGEYDIGIMGIILASGKTRTSLSR